MKNSKFFAFTKQKGFTLIEMSVVLVLAGILLSPLFLRFMDKRDQTIAKEEAENWITIAANAQEKYSTEPDYTGVTETIAKGLDIFPKSMLVGTAVQNKVKGAITCAAVDLTGTKDGWECTSANYPKAVCNAVVQKLDATMRRITVGSTVVKPTDQKVNLTDLSSACSGSTANSLKFVIPK